MGKGIVMAIPMGIIMVITITILMAITMGITILIREDYMETRRGCKQDRMSESDHLRASARRFRSLGLPATAILFEAEAWRLDNPGESILGMPVTADLSPLESESRGERSSDA